MDFEDGHTLLEVGQVNVDLAVKAAGAQQGFVEDVDAVGGRKDDDAGVRAEAVHLCEQLVEGVLTFVVTTEGRVLSAGAANGVDFVNEDDAGRLFLGLAEEVAHTAGTNADEHLDKIGAGKREKRHVRLTCHCFGQESLARSRWTDEQGAFGDFPAEHHIFLRVFQEVYNLLDFLLGAFLSGDVLESDV